MRNSIYVLTRIQRAIQAHNNVLVVCRNATHNLSLMNDSFSAYFSLVN
jgi:hypothetical protein